MDQTLDVLQLASELVAIDSTTHKSNVVICDFLEKLLTQCRCEVERLEYLDANGERKANLVARIGNGIDGLGFFSHCDTVPGTGWEQDPWRPVISDGRLTGLGSCDMKGPLAATIVAAATIDPSTLHKSLLIVITADEENRSFGASHVAVNSELFRASRPKHGIIAEPTRLIPVYAHKGGAIVTVTAHGRAAHTSTAKGISSNFIIAPFLARMAEVARLIDTDATFMNREFQPPTLSLNMIIDDGDCKANVTSAKTVCTLCFRPMPNDRTADVLAMISENARDCGLDVSEWVSGPFQVSCEAEIVRVALDASGVSTPTTAAFGTDAVVFKDHLELVILGPGDISQAHTVGEWIALDQLHESVRVYRRMIEMLCKGH